MSSRPERRKPQLAGASPVQPAPVTPIAAVPEPVEPAAKPRRNGGWSQVSIRLRPEDADRLRGAVGLVTVLLGLAALSRLFT